VVDHERLVIAEIAIDEPVHQGVVERLELLRGLELRNALAPVGVAHRVEEVGRRDLDRTRQRAVARRRPVDVELPFEEARGIEVRRS
jgi:hypothetical protein